MTKRKLIITVLVFLCVIGVLYIPVEFPESMNSLPEGDYIIVKSCVVTGAEWVIIGDQNGVYGNNSEMGEYINLTGKKPTNKYNSDIAGRWSDTYFICHVDYVGKSYLGEAYADVLSTYDVIECNILGNISRNERLFNLRPRSYVCMMDLIEKKIEKKHHSSLTFVN